MRRPLGHQGCPEPGDGASLSDHLKTCDFCLVASALELGDVVPGWVMTEEEAAEVAGFLADGLMLEQADGDWWVKTRAAPGPRLSPR